MRGPWTALGACIIACSFRKVQHVLSSLRQELKEATLHSRAGHYREYCYSIGRCYPPARLGEHGSGGQVCEEGNACATGDSGRGNGLPGLGSVLVLIGLGADSAPLKPLSPPTRAKRPLRSMLSSVLLPTFSSYSHSGTIMRGHCIDHLPQGYSAKQITLWPPYGQQHSLDICSRVCSAVSISRAFQLLMSLVKNRESRSMPLKCLSNMQQRHS